MADYLRNIEERAKAYWENGQSMEAGRLLFEHLPIDMRPKWACSILKLVVGKSGIRRGPVLYMLHIADSPAQWQKARGAFSVLSTSILILREKAQELDEDQKMLCAVLSLAELVAKVTYNATQPPDAFDLDSGWIASSLRGFVDWWQDEGFSKEAWFALCPKDTV